MTLGRARITAVAAAAALGAAGLATAAIPGDDGVVDLCYDKQGHVRVVDEGVACAKNETSLALAQQGPPGPPGADGAPGVAPAEFDFGAELTLFEGVNRFTDVQLESTATHLALVQGTIALHNTTSTAKQAFCTVRQDPGEGHSTIGDLIVHGVGVTLDPGEQEQITLNGSGTTHADRFYSLVLECIGEGLTVESSTLQVLLARET